MDIDKLFKIPKLPAGGSTKRKLPDNPTPELLKKMKMDMSKSSSPSSTPIRNGDRTSSTATQAKGRLPTVTMEEVNESDINMDRRDFAPGGDADYFEEEDEEGRFFGGGLTSEQKEILNIFENSGAEEGFTFQADLEELGVMGIRRMLSRFERAVNKNQDQRSKYPDDPSKFIDSEADLDNAIKALLPLAQEPVLAYPEFVRSGTTALLVGLLSHENADIVIDVVELVHELTDEDVGNEEDAGDVEESNAAALKILIEALLENSILELLVDNLPRLNEEEESDRQGVFHVLGIFENILGFNPQLSTLLVSKTSVLTWLLNRIQANTHGENRGYAAEILSILLQDNQLNRLELGRKDGIEVFLKVLSQYRRKDPADADETEFMENVFDALCSALNEPQIKSLFLGSEGVDLMVLMMKEKLQSRSRSIKALDYAMSGPSGTLACESFIDVLGLKTLFSVLMNKTKKKQLGTVPPASEDTSHILGIISSLFSNLASDSPSRIRLLAKFVENNYEKVDKLLEIRDNAASRLKVVEAEIMQEKDLTTKENVTVDENDAWYLRKLDAGLFTLQNVDYILAWIVMEDDGIRAHLLRMMDRRNKSLNDIISTLQIYHDNVDEGSFSVENDSNREASQKEILQELMTYLKSC